MKMDWTTGGAYITSSPLLVLLLEYRYNSLYIQYMYYFNNEFAYEHYQKKYNMPIIVEKVLTVLHNRFIIINYK